LVDDEKYNSIEKQANEFRKSIGMRLQRYLILKSWVSSNYVSDWWEEYVYLHSRSPLMSNSNICGADATREPMTKLPGSRAATFVHKLLLYRELINNQTVKPLLVQNLIPLCSSQYKRIFNTTRVPGIVTDKIVHLAKSSHIVVFSNGKWYKMPIYHKKELLNPKELEM
jgi:carnitine O-palmitoyltransferase 1